MRFWWLEKKKGLCVCVCVCVCACARVCMCGKTIEGSVRGSWYTCCIKYKCYFLDTVNTDQ